MRFHSRQSAYNWTSRNRDGMCQWLWRVIFSSCDYLLVFPSSHSPMCIQNHRYQRHWSSTLDLQAEQKKPFQYLSLAWHRLPFLTFPSCDDKYLVAFSHLILSSTSSLLPFFSIWSSTSLRFASLTWRKLFSQRNRWNKVSENLLTLKQNVNIYLKSSVCLHKSVYRSLHIVQTERSAQQTSTRIEPKLNFCDAT